MQIKVVAKNNAGFTRQIALVSERPDDDANDDRYPVTISRQDDGSIKLIIDLHEHELSRKASWITITVRP